MKRESIQRLFVAIVLLSFLAACPENGTAADHQLITSVALIHEYNDNIFFSNDDVQADNITTVAPKLDLLRHSERYTIRADGKLEFYRYEDNDELDDVDQWYNGSLTATPTERWQLGADAHVSDDNRPDRDVEETGLVLNNVQRKRINAGASTQYTVTEMMGAGMSLTFNRENFDDPETSDRKDYTAVLFLTRSLDAWLKRTTGRLNMSYSHYNFEREYERNSIQIADDYEVDYYGLTLGTESTLTERLNLTVNLGGRYTYSQQNLEVSYPYFPAQITDEDDENYGFVGNINFGYQGERYKCNLLLSHDLQPVSGENNTVNRTTARANGSYRFLERLSGNLYGQWYRNQNDPDDPTQSGIDTQTWNLGGGLRWTVNDYFDLAVSYVYTYLNDYEEHHSYHRNKALITLEAHHDWLE